MQQRYGVFKWQCEGFPDWLEWAGSLDEAKRRVQEMAKQSADFEYFVQDFVANSIVASSRDHQTRKKLAFHA